MRRRCCLATERPRGSWPGRVPGLTVALLLSAAVACEPGDGARPLTVAITADGGPINPYSGSNDFLIGLVYDKLFEPSPFVAEPEPGLAESATQHDATTWTVTLRAGVRWHDGRAFSAEDVKFTYEYYRDGPATRHGHHVSEVPRIETIEALDSLTVRFRCAYPCPLLRRVTFADLPIIPKHVWETVEEPRRYAELPVGTGPFRLVEYGPDRQYRFVANEAFYRGSPAVPEIVMPILPDQTATFLALRTGQIDAAARKLAPELVAQFASDSALRVVSTSALSIVELRPNYRKPPFAEPRFRRALSLVVDRAALVDRVLLGRARPGTRGYPHPDSPWTDPSLDTPHDAAHAAALLDSLDYRDRDGDGVRESVDGVPLRFSLYVNAGEPTWVRSAEMLVGQFAGIGVALTVRTLEAGVLSAYVGARNYDLFISEIGPHGAADPDQLVMSHRSGYLWEPTLPWPALDSLFSAWKAASTVESRMRQSFAIQQLMNAQPTSIALYYPDEFWAFRPSVYDAWAESPGYGIVHKWSFLPAAARGTTVVPFR